MAFETIVAVFDNNDHAKAAVNALIAGGFHDDDISFFDKSRMPTEPGAASSGIKEIGLWHRIFGGDIYKHEATVYGQTVEDGGTVVSLRVLDSEVAHATGILNLHRPIDVHDRAMTSGLAAPGVVQTAANAISEVPLAASQVVAVTPKVAETHGEMLRLAEEQLQVGKEMVETGATRVRRFTTEREVSQEVSLHDEHAEVLRHTLNEPVALSAIDWSDSSIEVVETAEHALVSKTARVVEEIALNKVGTDHVETVHEKLRRQQAEVIQLGVAAQPSPTARAV